MKYRLIAIDLDDTLLDEKLNISKANIEAIERAEKAGIHVTICTGRPFISARDCLKELNINIPIVTFNGAVIINLKDEKIYFKKPLNRNTAREVIKIGREKGLHIHLFIDNDWVVEEVNDYVEYYYSLHGYRPVVVDDLLDYLEKDPIKVILSSEPDTLKELEPCFKKTFKDANIFVSKPKFLEFVNPAANKGKALRYLAEELDISREKVVAIGDSFNDIPMIKYAGLGVAMGNAPDDVKKAADIVTLTSEEDGVAHIVNSIVNGLCKC